MIVDVLNKMIESILELYFCGVPCHQAVKIIGQAYKWKMTYLSKKNINLYQDCSMEDDDLREE